MPGKWNLLTPLLVCAAVLISSLGAVSGGGLDAEFSNNALLGKTIELEVTAEGGELVIELDSDDAESGGPVELPWQRLEVIARGVTAE